MRSRVAVIAVALIAAGTLTTATADTHHTVMTDVRLTMDDGVTLTADVYIPTAPDGDDADSLYPCVVELTPYRKESRASEGASYLPGAGIVLIEVDARGTGGSEGEYDIVFSVREQADAAAWVEWAATQATDEVGQPLCEETVGMYGGSYSGIIQYLVASLPDEASDDLPARPGHLAAIAPQRAYGDLYRDIVYHGGQVIGSFGTVWSAGTTAFYTQPPTDIDTAAGQDAWLDHLTQNDVMILPYLENQYADARWRSDDSPGNYEQDLYTDSSILPRIENLTVPTLHLAGFYDSFTRGQLLTFSRAHQLEMLADGARGPNFLIVGPWNHGGTHFITPDQGFKEHLGEWYRYWLEDGPEGRGAPDWIANGFDGGGARVRYLQQRSTAVNPPAPIPAADGEWRDAPTWPIPGTTMERLYLRAGGGLSADPAPRYEGETWVHNPTAGTAETLSRWDNAAFGAAYVQWDQQTENGKGLTFSTGPLDADLEIAGPIAMKLYASIVGPAGDPSLAETWPGVAQALPPYLDADFVVKVSDVAPDGTATLVTQGYLRASHRAVDLEQSEWLDGELVSPFHPHTLAALDPPTSEVVRSYDIEIWPTAKTFPAGHELMIQIYSADTPNHITLEVPSATTVALGGEGASYIALPVK